MCSPEFDEAIFARKVTMQVCPRTLKNCEVGGEYPQASLKWRA
jgi:hypothetical protein